jgi:AraC-like DNA-binding protein
VGLGVAGFWRGCPDGGGAVGLSRVRVNTFRERRRLYLLARVVIGRHHARRDLTLGTVARVLCCSSRQLQRAFAQFGERTFQEELAARRMTAAAQLLAEQPLPIREVATRAGYSRGPHFAAAFRRHHGLSPTRFREREMGRLGGRGSGYGTRLTGGTVQ